MTDVAVVGGGVIGLSVAWRLAAAGVSVAVYDETPGNGASWAAAGMLAPLSEARFGEEDLLHLNRVAAERYDAFVCDIEAATGMTVGYRTEGTMMVGLTRDDVVRLDEHCDYLRANGITAATLSSRECRALEPGLAPAICGGLHLPDDHQIDNRRLLAALREACAQANVRFVHTGVEEINTDDNRVISLTLADGVVLDASRVVLATGAKLPRIYGNEHVLPPIRPVGGEIIRLQMPAAPATRVLRGYVRGFDVYIVCRADGGVVVGATTNERALDDGPTAGGVYRLLADARELLPELDEATFVEAIARRRPGAPDCAPVVGPSAVEGLFFALGHYRNGMLLAPITADAIEEMVVRSQTPEYIRPFSVERFATKGAMT
jgi:glycine oxidase